MARLTKQERSGIQHRQEWWREWHAIRGRIIKYDELARYEATLAAVEAERDVMRVEVAKRDELLCEAYDCITSHSATSGHTELIGRMASALKIVRY